MKSQHSAVDELFKLPLGEFTSARNALVARLKKEGRKAEAEKVKAIAKPTATAWAVNQLAWSEPHDLERLFAIGDSVRRAQTGKGGDLRALLEQRRALVLQLTRRGGEILRKAGHAASPDAARKMTITLESLTAWGRSNVEQEAGRLTADLEPLGFDGLAAMLDGKNLEPAKVLQFRKVANEGKAAEDAAAARARAREAIKEAEKVLANARRKAERADAAVAKTTARADALEEQKRELEARCAKAKQEVRDAAHEAQKTAQQVAEATRALERAHAALPRDA